MEVEVVDNVDGKKKVVVDAEVEKYWEDVEVGGQGDKDVDVADQDVDVIVVEAVVVVIVVVVVVAVVVVVVVASVVVAIAATAVAVVVDVATDVEAIRFVVVVASAVVVVVEAVMVEGSVGENAAGFVVGAVSVEMTPAVVPTGVTTVGANVIRLGKVAVKVVIDRTLVALSDDARSPSGCPTSASVWVPRVAMLVATTTGCVTCTTAAVVDNADAVDLSIGAVVEDDQLATAEDEALAVDAQKLMEDVAVVGVGAGEEGVEEDVDEDGNSSGLRVVRPTGVGTGEADGQVGTDAG